MSETKAKKQAFSHPQGPPSTDYGEEVRNLSENPWKSATLKCTQQNKIPNARLTIINQRLLRPEQQCYSKETQGGGWSTRQEQRGRCEN